jgi:uncharacterized membrane protein YdjX (TVP38/TMEM64 family)
MKEPAPPPPQPDARKPASLATRLVPLAIVLAAIAAVYATGLHRFLSLEALRDNFGSLESFVAERRTLAILAFAGAYIAVVALSLPGASLMSLLGGLLFGLWLGTATVVIAATLGAVVIFLVARTAFGDALKAKAGGAVAKLEAGFRDNAFSYLLLLRLIPVFPFFLVNIAPAFFNMRTLPYAAATLIGIVPGVFAYVSAGRGLGAVLESGGEINLSGLLLKPEVLTPIVAMSALALLPIVLKALKIYPKSES